MKKRIPISEAASQLGCSTESIRLQCVSGLRGAKKVRGVWTVTPKAVNRLRDAELPRIAGRQPIKITAPTADQPDQQSAPNSADESEPTPGDEALALLLNYLSQGRKRVNTKQAALAGIAFFKLAGICLDHTIAAFQTESPEDAMRAFFRSIESRLSKFIADIEEQRGGKVEWDDRAGFEHALDEEMTDSAKSKPTTKDKHHGNRTKK